MALATFKTGRTRAVTFGGPITAGAAQCLDCIQDPGGGLVDLYGYVDTTSVLTIGCEGFNFWALAKVSHPAAAVTLCSQIDWSQPLHFGHIGMTITYGTDIVTAAYLSIDTLGHCVTVNANGSWTFVYQVEEWCMVDLLGGFDSGAVSTINGTQFPKFGGAAYGDGTPALGCQFYEQFADSSLQTFMATMGGVPITLAELAPRGQVPTYDVTIGIDVTAVGESQACSVSTLFNGTSFGAAYDYNYLPDAVIDATSGLYVFCGGTPNCQWANGGAALTPPTKYSGDFRMRCFGDATPFPVNLLGQIKAINGSPVTTAFTAYSELLTNWEQDYYSCSGEFENLATAGGITTLPSSFVDELCPIRLWLTNLSLTYDDTRDWRCQIRGKPYQYATMSQNASLSVASGGTKTNGVTITPTQTNWEGYRYLQFTANQNGSFTIGTKKWSWTVTTPGVAQTITLDLCSPTSWTGNGGVLLTLDERSSRFPLVAGSTSPTSSNPDESSMADISKGLYWGVFRATSITFNCAVGTIVTLGALSLIRQSDALVTFLPKFYPDGPSYSNATAQPFVTQESDGKLCGDWPAMENISSSSYNFETLSTLSSYLSYLPGWNFTLVSTFPSDGWHNASRYAAWAMGSGSYWQGSWSGQWFDGVDI